MLRRLLFPLATSLSLANLGCQGPEPNKAAPKVTSGETATAAVIGAPTKSDGKGLFEKRCAVCHGTTGKGDGPGAQAMNPRPPAFDDPKWQASVSDEALRKIILEGGPAVGKSPGMPAQMDLKDSPELLTELVTFIRARRP